MFFILNSNDDLHRDRDQPRDHDHEHRLSRKFSGSRPQAE